MSSSLAEVTLLPSWAKKEGLTRCFVYTGPSMRPTFRGGQLLYVRPKVRDISVGDVVVFTNKSRKRHIVHRVISITDEGLITRGDNNLNDDPAPIPPNLVIGRVEMRESKENIKAVQGKGMGLWLIRLNWQAHWAKAKLRGIPGAMYVALRDSRIIHKIVYPFVSQYMETVYLETKGITVIKITYKGNTVARWIPQNNYTEYRRPYDLFIPLFDLSKKED